MANSMIPNNLSFNRAFSFINNKFYHVLSVVFLLSVFLTWGCEEESSFLGLEIQPPSDRLSLKFSGQNAVEAFTFTLDSINADKFAVQLLGEINDPVFGHSKADFISKMAMSTYGYSFGETPVLDSMFLFLTLTGTPHGDKTASHIIKVFELTDTIYYDSLYNSNIDPLTFHNPGSPVATYIYNPGTKDTLIKIPITDPLFRAKLFEIDSASKATEANFHKYFAGLYVTAEKQSEPGSILTLSLGTINSNISLFFHNTKDTLVYRYHFGTFVAKVNLFRHDYSSAVFYPNLNQTSIQDSVVYVQSMGGLAARLLFPGLETWRDSVPVAINKAKLVLPIELLDLTASDYPRPSRLILLTRDDEGLLQVISDYNAGSAYFGGSFNPDLQAYVFNITNQAQKYIQGSIEDIDLYLLVNDIATTPNRLVLNSGNHSNPIRLEITYQRF
jgi:hypothetical protein